MNIQQIAPQIVKPEVSIDGVSEIVDFQQMMLSMLGLLVPAQGHDASGNNEVIQSETSGIQTTLSIVDEIQPQIVNQLSEEGFVKMAQQMAKMPAKTIEMLTSAFKDMTGDDMNVDMQIADIEKALGVERMDIDSSHTQVQHTMQSLQNIMRMKFVQNITKDVESNPEPVVDTNSESKFKTEGLGLQQSDIDFKLKNTNETVPNQSTAKPVKIENLDQIREIMVNAIKETTTEGSSRIKISLKPVELGSMEVELKMEKGALEALVRVKDETVKVQISEVFSSLKDQFSKEGLQIRNFEVTTQLGQGQQQEQTMHHRQGDRHRQTRQDVTITDEETIMEDASSISRFA